MIRTLIAAIAFVAIAAPTLSAFADCASHSTTVQSTTAPQTVVQTGTTPMTTIPPVTPKTGG